VTEESQAKGGIAADAVQSVFGNVSNLVESVGAEVAEFLGLQTAPHLG
jgi:hypothetical protein